MKLENQQIVSVYLIFGPSSVDILCACLGFCLFLELFTMIQVLNDVIWTYLSQMYPF